MSNLKFKEENIKYDILPYIKGSINYMNLAYELFKKLDIPDNFIQKKYLNYVKQNINSLKEEINNIQNNIIKAYEKIKKIENKRQNFNNFNRNMKSIIAANTNVITEFTEKNKQINKAKETMDTLKKWGKKNDTSEEKTKFSSFVETLVKGVSKETKPFFYTSTNSEKQKNLFDYWVSGATSIISGAGNLANSAWNGVGNLANSAWNGKGGIKDSYGKITNDIGNMATTAWTTYTSGWHTILDGTGWVLNSIWNGKGGIKDFWTNPQKAWSTYGVFAEGFLEGILKFTENLVDGTTSLGGVIITPGLWLGDLVGNITGNDWNITNNYWNNLKQFVSYDVTKDYADAYYSLDSVKIMNESSYVKRDSEGHGVAKNIGSIAASIGLAGGTSLLTEIPMAATASSMAGISSFGRYNEEGFNKNSIDITYGSNDLSINLDYNTFKQIKDLKVGNNIIIKQVLQTSNGENIEIKLKIESLGNGKYNITDQYGNKIDFKELNESDTVKTLTISGIKSIRDGVLYYAGAKVNMAQFESIVGNISNPFLKTFIQSTIRVFLDTASAASTVPFDSLVTAIVNNETIEQAWNENGGTNAMISQIITGAAFSFTSEISNISSAYKGTKIAKKINTEGYTQKDLNKISKLKGYGLKSYVEESIKNGTFEETFKFINKQELSNIENMFNNTDLQKITDTKLDYKIHIEDNILTSNLKDKITQEQLEYMKNLKGDDLEAFMTKASQTGKLKDVMNYLDQKEIKKISPKNKNIKLDDELNIKNSGESPKTKLNKNYIKKFLEKSDFNKKNLVEGIIKQLPDNLDDVTKARLIYLKLNEAVSYSDEYLSAERFSNGINNENIINDIYNKQFDIHNMTDNNVICSNWSQIYRDLLIESGIDESNIKIVGNNNSHKFVTVDLGDGNLLIADGTKTFFHQASDLTNCKFGLKTNGFFTVNKAEWLREIEQYADDSDAIYNALNNFSLKSNRMLLVDKVDKKIGYGSKDMPERLEKIKELSSLYESQKSTMNINEKTNLFISIFDVNSSAIDSFTIFRKYSVNFFGDTSSVYLYGDGTNIKAVISYKLPDGQTQYLVKHNSENIQILNEIDFKNSIIGYSKK